MAYKISREEIKVKDVPTKDELLGEVGSEVNTSHLLASLEFSIDLILDMQFKMLDALVKSGAVTLTTKERATYASLKGAHSAHHSFNLEESAFADGKSVVEYMYHFKALIMAKREEYYAIKEKIGVKE